MALRLFTRNRIRFPLNGDGEPEHIRYQCISDGKRTVSFMPDGSVTVTEETSHNF